MIQTQVQLRRKATQEDADKMNDADQNMFYEKKFMPTRVGDYIYSLQWVTKVDRRKKRYEHLGSTWELFAVLEEINRVKV